MSTFSNNNPRPTRKGTAPHQKTHQPRPYRGKPARGYDATTGTWRPKGATAGNPPGVPNTETKEPS